ncbi:hypothetical protein [Polyangium aurulentum]|uniref:hypothetical protein n=1 Tax=Polyangium aurulentum TaxID=2567896 RepID=UPI0010ADB603|nr:hypothetical protein [Polyangium aurulentum]UQA59357.1 hypothetical protein E8A73_002265 [Polyangium aurulentum]
MPGPSLAPDRAEEELANPPSSIPPSSASPSSIPPASVRNSYFRSVPPSNGERSSRTSFTPPLSRDSEPPAPSRDSEPPPSSVVPSSRAGGLLGAGLSFLDGVALNRITKDDLRSWIDRHLVHTGFMPRPWRIQEPLIGVLPTDRQCSAFLPEMPPADETAALLVRARARVIGQLRGLVMSPPDDRFLSAAIFAGRVRRVMNGKDMIWVPRPRPHDALSDVVLSLFVADVLRRREFYAANLCICDTCGRVRFDEDPRMRRACFDHVPEVPARPTSRRRLTPVSA